MKRSDRATLGICVVSLVAAMSSVGNATALTPPRSGNAVVKPGAKVTYNETFCTMNFVFKGSDGHKYVGTAGHCPLADAQDTIVWKTGKGIPAGDGSGNPIGEFAFATYDKEAHLDFALVRLDPTVRPDPQMEHFGGPTGLNDEVTYGTELINMYGHGTGLSYVSPERQLLAPNGFDGKDRLLVEGVLSGGDSGAPATTDENEALGIVTEGGAYLRIAENGVAYPAISMIVRLPHNIDHAEDKLGIRLKLLLAPPL